MIIRGWHIDGFGHFADWRSPDLAGGLTVVLGPNEAGKSTLLAFLRGVLFGFPSKNARDDAHIPPLKGGLHGGRVFLADEEGQSWTVERHKGKKPLLHSPTGEILGEAELTALLGHLDAASYRSVFGFDLTDLGKLQALDETSVRDRLLSAWVTGAGDSVSATTKVLDARIKEPLKEKGAIRNLLEGHKEAEKVLKEARARASSFPEQLQAHGIAREKIRALTGEVWAARAGETRLKGLIKLKPTALLLSEARAALDSLPPPRELPADAQERAALLLSELKAAAAERDRLDRRTRDLKSRSDALTFDAALCEARPQLSKLEKGADSQRDRLAESAQIASRLGLARGEADRFLGGLGPNWNRSRLAALDPSPAKQRCADLFAREISEARLEVKALSQEEARCAARLDAFGTPGPEGADYHRPSPYPPFAMGAGIVLGAAAAALSEVGPLKWAALATALLLAALLAYRGARPKRGPAEGEAMRFAKTQAAADLAGVRAQLTGREKALLDLLTRWSAECSQWGLRPGIDPGEAHSLLLQGSQAAQKFDEADQLASQLSGIADKISVWELEAGELLRNLPAFSPSQAGPELVSAVEELSARAASEEAKRREAQTLGSELAKAQEELRAGGEEAAAREAYFSGYLASLGAGAMEELRAAAEAGRERVRLSERIAEYERQLELHFGSDVDGREELLLGSLSGWEERLAAEEARIGVLDRGLELENQRYGAQEKVLADLRSSADVQEVEAALGRFCAEGSELAAHWRRAALARELLKAALDKYAAERQPGVLSEASRHYRSISGGRYTGVVQPPGQQLEVRVVREDGTVHDPATLSRGAREELYFSIRLGLARDFHGRGARLPILADDVFVNFDPVRAQAAFCALSSFAADSQAIIFTCHPETAARIKRAHPATNVVSLGGDPA